MGVVVKVTRRGQTTLPAEYRTRLGISEGDNLLIEETERGLLVRRIPDILTLAANACERSTRDAWRSLTVRFLAAFLLKSSRAMPRKVDVYVYACTLEMRVG